MPAAMLSRFVDVENV